MTPISGNSKMQIFKLPSLLPLLLLPTLTLTQGLKPAATYPAIATGSSYLTIAPGLEISAYYEFACKGGPGGPILTQVKYGQAWAVQFKSYSLSRALQDNEEMDFFDALPQGGPLNTKYNGDWQATCQAYMGSAHGKINASIGCHDVAQAYGCMKVWLPPDDEAKKFAELEAIGHLFDGAPTG